MLHPFFVPAQNGAPWLRLDVWEKGNISIVQLEEKLRGAARQALADAIMELRLLPASLCTEDTSPGTWDPENIPGPGKTVSLVRLPRMGVREGIAKALSKVHTHSYPFILRVSKATRQQKYIHAAGHPLQERDSSSGSSFIHTHSCQLCMLPFTDRRDKEQSGKSLSPVSGLGCLTHGLMVSDGSL